MKRLIISDTVRASRNIFMSHVSQYPQNDVRGRFGSAQIAPSTSVDLVSSHADDDTSRPVSHVTVSVPNISITPHRTVHMTSSPDAGPAVTHPPTPHSDIAIAPSSRTVHLLDDDGLPSDDDNPDVLAPESQVIDRPEYITVTYDDFHPIIRGIGGQVDLSMLRSSLITDEFDPRPLFPDRTAVTLAVTSTSSLLPLMTFTPPLLNLL